MKTGSPVYYKQFIGSTPDVSAFADVLTESTLRHSDCTIIADKGFASESDFGLLDSKTSNMSFLFAAAADSLKANCL